MSVCGQSGQTEEDSGSEEVTASAAAVRDIYKQKPASKVVRVLTVLAYLLSVSLAAILLSVYYVCVWRSPELPRLNGTEGELSARRAPLHAAHHYMLLDRTNFTGGGDSGVKAVVAPTPEDSSTVPTSPTGEDATTDPLLEFATDSTLTPESLNSTFDSGTNGTDVT